MVRIQTDIVRLNLNLDSDLVLVWDNKEQNSNVFPFTSFLFSPATQESEKPAKT